MFFRGRKVETKLNITEITSLLNKCLSDYTKLGQYKVVKIRETVKSNQTTLKELVERLDNGGVINLSFASILELMRVLSQFDNHYLKACKVHGVKVDVSSLLTHWYINRIKQKITDQDQLCCVIALLPESQHDHFKQQLSEITATMKPNN